MSIARLYVSGHVQRWHQNPTMAATGQTLADHQGRCVQLLLALNPLASRGLIRAVAHHDVGEFVTGDLSADFKRVAGVVAARHAEVEADARQAICGADPQLSPVEKAWLKLVDRLESAAYVLVTRPWEESRAASGWADAISDLCLQADDMGCGAKVRELIHDLRMGSW